MTEHQFPVTKDELEQIKHDCKYPEDDCIGCEHEDPVIGCSFDCENLIQEIIKREPHLDLDEVLDELCNIDLAQFTEGTRVAEDVSKCEGESCNYCGRWNK